jgi:PBSX family phage terminase large subunit
MQQKIVNLLRHQLDFLSSQEKFVLLAGGVGSGKTFAGAHFVIQESITDPEPMGLISANTYNQLINATLQTLFAELDNLGLRYEYNQQKKMLKIEKSKWLTYSMDNYDMVRGVEVGKLWNDETRDLSYQAFLMLMGRLRDKRAKKLKARFTSTPLGFTFLYDYFIADKKTDEFRAIKASSYDNPYLPESYIESMQASYDEKIFKQEVMGEFLSTTQGRIYYAFDREKHVKRVEKHQNYPIWVGMDFNVSPMTAAICQHYNDTIYVIDEIWIKNSNTSEAGKYIGQKYGFNLPIVPDSTGRAMKTQGVGMSDHEILRQMGFDVKSTNNPFRIDRYNTVNGLLSKNKIVISDKCQRLIKDLEQVTYKEGTSLPDTSDSDLTHISDALGYYVYYCSPIYKKQQTVSVYSR